MEVKYKFPKMKVDEKRYRDYEFETLDKQLSLLPKETKFCEKCIMPNQRPRTQFDEKGVCNACNYAEKKFNGGIDWQKREEDLASLLEKHRSKDGKWDVIVPGSGGKDGSIVLHQLKEKYGMHPLHITWCRAGLIV